MRPCFFCMSQPKETLDIQEYPTHALLKMTDCSGTGGLYIFFFTLQLRLNQDTMRFIIWHLTFRIRVEQVRLEAVLGRWSWAGFPSWCRLGMGWGTGWGRGWWGWSWERGWVWQIWWHQVWRRLRRWSTWSPRRRRSSGRGLGLQAGHADLRAALAEDGQLRPPVHPTARQRRMPVLQVHSKVPVHRPAAPFPLDLRLHLEGYTSQGHY